MRTLFLIVVVSCTVVSGCGAEGEPVRTDAGEGAEQVLPTKPVKPTGRAEGQYACAAASSPAVLPFVTWFYGDYIGHDLSRLWESDTVREELLNRFGIEELDSYLAELTGIPCVDEYPPYPRLSSYLSFLFAADKNAARAALFDCLIASVGDVAPRHWADEDAPAFLLNVYRSTGDEQMLSFLIHHNQGVDAALAVSLADTYSWVFQHDTVAFLEAVAAISDLGDQSRVIEMAIAPEDDCVPVLNESAFAICDEIAATRESPMSGLASRVGQIANRLCPSIGTGL